MPRPAHLITIGVDAIDQLLQRPEQTRACSVIATLIDGLRHASTDREYLDVQAELFKGVTPAQAELMEARRNVHREQLRAGAEAAHRAEAGRGAEAVRCDSVHGFDSRPSDGQCRWPDWPA